MFHVQVDQIPSLRDQRTWELFIYSLNWERSQELKSNAVAQPLLLQAYKMQEPAEKAAARDTSPFQSTVPHLILEN